MLRKYLAYEASSRTPTSDQSKIFSSCKESRCKQCRLRYAPGKSIWLMYPCGFL